MNDRKETDIEILIKNLMKEIQTINGKISDIQKSLPNEETPSEACLIMVMKLEVAFLLVNKMFSSGTFEPFNFNKDDVKETDIKE